MNQIQTHEEKLAGADVNKIMLDYLGLDATIGVEIMNRTYQKGDDGPTTCQERAEV